jgi:hypothetical protein
MKTLLVTVIFASTLALFAAMSESNEYTCVGPEECTEDSVLPAPGAKQIEHIKRITCGPWPDAPEAFVFYTEVPLGVIPLAGEYGATKDQQCWALRNAVEFGQ